jgi:hypothetical protein
LLWWHLEQIVLSEDRFVASYWLEFDALSSR